MRLAVFSPLPPVRSGIADYTADLLSELGRGHEVEVFVASTEEQRWAPRDAPFRLRGAHDFVWARRRTPYDLVLYQLGNAWCHDYMWPYLFRWPGLVVLHDAHLHHARAWSLLRRHRDDDYRAELAFNHPSLPPEASEIALNGFSGPLYYFWPMLRTVVESARAVAVHNAVLADDLRVEFPGAAVRHVPMGVPDPLAPAAAARAMRARYGFGEDDVVFLALGAITAEKRLEPALRGLAAAARYVPGLRLLLVGQPLPHFDVQALAADSGIADRVVVSGFVGGDELGACLAASDVVLSLRWPSAGETSASWLRAIAAGRPTIVTDRRQLADVPVLDPRSWTVLHGQPVAHALEPVAVAIDIMDEQHSLTLAIKRLAADAGLRRQLGAAARRFWQQRHRLAHMVAAYGDAIAEAANRRELTASLPRHLRPDPSGFARGLVSEFEGVRLFDPAL